LYIINILLTKKQSFCINHLLLYNIPENKSIKLPILNNVFTYTFSVRNIAWTFPALLYASPQGDTAVKAAACRRDSHKKAAPI
jgi:hypothetical protein